MYRGLESGEGGVGFVAIKVWGSQGLVLIVIA